MMACRSWELPTWWQMCSTKSLGNITLSGNAGSTWFFLESPWIARRWRIVSDEFGSEQYWNLFSGPLPFCKWLNHGRIDQCGESSNCEKNIRYKILNSIASSSPRGTERSCRSNLFNFFATANEYWSCFPGSTTIHSRLLNDILALRVDDIGIDVCFGPALAGGLDAQAPVVPS